MVVTHRVLQTTGMSFYCTLLSPTKSEDCVKLTYMYVSCCNSCFLLIGSQWFY